MCEPLTLVGVALSGLSAGLNHMANQKVEAARSDALAAERIRQQGLDQQADALNAQSQDRFQNIAPQQEQRAKSLADFFTSQQVQAPAQDAAPASDSNITVQAEQKARGDAKARTDQMGTALGNLRSFGDLFGDLSRLQARDAARIGQIGGFKRGSSGVLGLELDAAGGAGSGLRTAGEIAGGLGRVATGTGLSGSNVFNLGSTAVAAKPVNFFNPTSISSLY